MYCEYGSLSSICTCIYDIVCSQLEREGSLSAEELARLAAVSITLATERLVWLTFSWEEEHFSLCFFSRLLITGKACRDDSLDYGFTPTDF